jgi:hypothetical protein
MDTVGMGKCLSRARESHSSMDREYSIHSVSASYSAQVLEVDQVGPSMLLASGDSFILRVDIACGKDLAAHHCPVCN